MLYFFLALLFSVGILLLFKVFEKYKVRNLSAIIIGYFVSALLALSISYHNGKLTEIVGLNALLAVILGISFVIGFIFLSLSTQQSGISITSVASNISIIIPVLVAALFYKEEIHSYHLIGLVLSIPAIYLFFKPSKSANFSFHSLLFPIILFFISGINNSLMRQAEKIGAMQSPMFFLGLIFLISLLVSAFYGFLIKKIKYFSKQELIMGLLLGSFNFAATYYFLRCLSDFPSALFFPIYNLSFIGLSAFVGIFLFKEHFSKINYIGLLVAAISILLMNIPY